MAHPEEEMLVIEKNINNSNDVYDDDLPPPLKNQVHTKSFVCVVVVALLGETSRGLVVPLLWPYLQLLHGSLQLLGVVSSAFSFARFFAAPFFGYWANKRSHREAMLICLAFLIVGNLLYAVYPPPWLLLISRVIVGIGAGTLGQARGYVSQVTTKEQRTTYMSYLTVSQFAGFAVAPGIVAVLYFVDFDLFTIERVEVDMYSSAGYLLCILSIAAFVFVYFWFKEPPVALLEVDVELRQVSSYTFKDKVYMSLHSVPDKVKSAVKNPQFSNILLFSMLIFVTRGSVAVLETVNSELTMEYFGWGSEHTGFVLCILGIIGSAVLFSLPMVVKKVGEGHLLLVGLASLVAGLFLIMPWQRKATNEIQFIIGLGLTWSLGSALCQTLITSFLSRVLGPKPQAGIMGWMASLGSIARVIGALWAGFAISTPAGANLAVGVVAGLMFACMMCTIVVVRKRNIVNV